MTQRPAALLTLALTLAAYGCRSEPDPEPTREPTAAVQAEESARTTVTARVPITDWRTVDPDQLERERLEASWRQPAEQDRTARAQPPATAAGQAPSPAVRAGAFPVESLRSRGPATEPTATAAADDRPAAAESWEDISPDGFEGPPALPAGRESAGPTVLRVQRALDRLGFSPGVIDGRWGKNTEKAVYWLQDALGLETTGTVDQQLWARLEQAAAGPPVRRHTLAGADVAGPYVTIPEEPVEQAELECLCYESQGEALAERFHTTEDLLRRLNPGVDLETAAAGTALLVPDVEVIDKARTPRETIARLLVSKGGRYLHAVDAEGNVLLHLPTVIGADYDPSPEGDYQVVGIAYDPDFHYQPELFADVPDTDEDALLPAGPNSPVGRVWIALSKEHFGIHGTAAPETIGYTSSHGCIRLTNWDVLRLANVLPSDVPVEFRP